MKLETQKRDSESHQVLETKVKKMCSDISDEVKGVCSDVSVNTLRDNLLAYTES